MCVGFLCVGFLWFSEFEGKIAYEDMADRLFYIENRHIGAVDLSSGDDVRWLY